MASFAGADTGKGGIESVAEQMAPRFKATLFLAGTAAVIAIPLSLTLGILAALYRNSAYDRFINITTLSAISSPEFFLAYILILFLAFLNPLLALPVKLQRGFAVWRKTLLHTPTRFNPNTCRNCTNDADDTGRDYQSFGVTLHRNGAAQGRVALAGHPHSRAPKRTGTDHQRDCPEPWHILITGVVVIEVVFVYPGIGQLFVDSVKNRDIPIVQACCLPFVRSRLYPVEPNRRHYVDPL